MNVIEMHNFWQHLLKIADWNLPIHPIPSYPMEISSGLGSAHHKRNHKWNFVGPTNKGKSHVSRCKVCMRNVFDSVKFE